MRLWAGSLNRHHICDDNGTVQVVKQIYTRHVVVHSDFELTLKISNIELKKYKQKLPVQTIYKKDIT